MNKHQRDELRKLADAATPGPWKAEDEYGGNAIYPHGRSAIATPCYGFNVAEDFNFIAASRTAIPVLLDRIEKLEKALRWYEIRAKNIANMEDNILCNFSMADLVEDKGQRARDALQMEGI